MDYEFEMYDNFQDTEDCYAKREELSIPKGLVERIKHGIEATVDYVSSIEAKRIAVPGLAVIGLLYFAGVRSMASRAEHDLLIQHSKQMVAEQVRIYNPTEFSQDKELQEILREAGD